MAQHFNWHRDMIHAHGGAPAILRHEDRHRLYQTGPGHIHWGPDTGEGHPAMSALFPPDAPVVLNVACCGMPHVTLIDAHETHSVKFVCNQHEHTATAVVTAHVEAQEPAILRTGKRRRTLAPQTA